MRDAITRDGWAIQPSRYMTPRSASGLGDNVIITFLAMAA